MEIRLVVCKCTAGGANPKHVHMHMEVSHEGLGCGILQTYVHKVLYLCSYRGLA